MKYSPRKGLLLFVMSAQAFSLADSAIDKYPGIFVGKDSWIYIRNDLKQLTTARNVKSSWAQEKLNLVDSISKALNSKGIYVVIALVPDRVDLYPEFLPDDLFQESSSSGVVYPSVLDELSKRGLNTVDIFSAIKSSPYFSSKAKTYFSQDAHWNAYGASAAAKAVAEDIWQHVQRSSIPEVDYIFDPQKPVENKGRSYRDGLPEAIRSTVSFEETIPYKSGKTNKDEGDKILSKDAPKVVIVGTSFTGYGLKQSLVHYLSADILDMSVPGKGVWVPMANYLSSESFKEDLPKVLVWEMPELVLISYPLPKDTEGEIFKDFLIKN